jgi:hypothetical protein
MSEKQDVKMLHEYNWHRIMTYGKIPTISPPPQYENTDEVTQLREFHSALYNYQQFYKFLTSVFHHTLTLCC